MGQFWVILPVSKRFWAEFLVRTIASRAFEVVGVWSTVERHDSHICSAVSDKESCQQAEPREKCASVDERICQGSSSARVELGATN